MVAITRSLPLLKEHFDSAPELFTVVLNATSLFEANLALDVLRETTPERVLVAAINMREVLHELPGYPCAMAVPDDALARVAGLTKDRATYRKQLDDEGLSLAVNTAGNFCFDLIVERDGRSILWCSPTPASDVVNAALVPHLVECETLLPAIIDLANDMGMVLNPHFYLSLDDWHLENAQQSLSDVQALF